MIIPAVAAGLTLLGLGLWSLLPGASPPSVATSTATPETQQALLAALDDSYRLVRIRAANALATYPAGLLNPDDRARLTQATQELLDSFQARPDDWASHYNLGNFYFRQIEDAKALEAFTLAHALRPDTVLPLVNASLAHARFGQNDRAEASSREALKLEPQNAARYGIFLLSPLALRILKFRRRAVQLLTKVL